MNLLNLQVRIKKIKIKTNNNCSLCFSLRLGKILSTLSTPIFYQSNAIIQPNIDLIIGCQDNCINNNSKACLIIYQIGLSQQRNIIGMVFIFLKNQQNQINRYKIQQSHDDTAFLQLNFSITNLQILQKQNESIFSKSSLAQIKQFHRLLTQSYKKSNSDYQNYQIKKQPSQDHPKQKNFKFFKVQRIKTQQTQHLATQQTDISCTIMFKKIQKQLNDQKQKNSLLTHLLVIQQSKNTESEILINNIINTLIISQQSNPIPELKLINKDQHQKQDNLKLQRQIINITINSSNLNKIQQKVDQITHQRDYLYQTLDQLYQKNKKIKDQYQLISVNFQNIEKQLLLSNQSLQNLLQQNLQLKNIILQSNHSIKNQNLQQSNQIKLLTSENQQIKKQLIQFQRKFKQSIKALQQFKNDAWKAQQELILKDQQIAKLTQNYSIAKQSLKNLQKESLSTQNIKNSKQSIQVVIETVKKMIELMRKNSLRRDSIFQQLKINKEVPTSQSNEINAVRITGIIKAQIDKICQQYDTQNTKTTNVLEIRKKIMNSLNSLHF